MEKSTISAYQKVLKDWIFIKPRSFSEEFAQKRFLKKFQEPDESKEQLLAQKAWDEFLEFDSRLPTNLNLPSGEWYKARHMLQNLCRGFSLRGPIEFPKGSSFEPTAGLNSIESRLVRGSWTCTPENFDKFSRLVYTHKALKRAFRVRYYRWFRQRSFDISFRDSNKYLWSELKDPFAVFCWKLQQIVKFVRGSRFATVPKNNDTRRPINIEPFGNILNQRQIGIFLRRRLSEVFGIDLDNLQSVHKVRISDHRLATIDLKNASDSISLALCSFLLPSRFLSELLSSRSPMLLGYDKQYHLMNKISSMGNGFTFELMTVILTCVAKVLDKDATVFGDDIIIRADAAPRLIELLTEVGWVVNKEKSFLEGPFRESCGANHHVDEGYVKSFDFHWPSTTHDCAILLSKCYALKEYPSFNQLYCQLLKRTPKALRGGTFTGALIEPSWSQPSLTSWFLVDSITELPECRDPLNKLIRKAFHVHDVRVGFEFCFVAKEKTPMVSDLQPRLHRFKYEMYLAAGRRARDEITGEGRWVRKRVFYLDGLLTRLTSKHLLELRRS